MTTSTITTKIISPRRFSIFILILSTVAAGIFLPHFGGSLEIIVGMVAWAILYLVTYLPLTRLEFVILFLSTNIWLFGMYFLKSFPSNTTIQIPIGLVSIFAMLTTSAIGAEARKREGSRLTITIMLLYFLLFALGVAIRTLFNLK